MIEYTVTTTHKLLNRQFTRLNVHFGGLFLSQRQSNASQTLCDIIRLSRDQANQLQEMSQPDPLLTVLES